MGLPSRGALIVEDFLREPGARRTGVIYPVYSVAQGKNPVNNFWTERGALSGGQVSREAEGGFPLIHRPQRGVNHYCEVGQLVFNGNGRIPVVESKGGHSYIEVGVVDRGAHDGAGVGRVGTGGHCGPRIGRSLLRGNGSGGRCPFMGGGTVYAGGGRGAGLGGQACNLFSMVPIGGRSGCAGRECSDRGSAGFCLLASLLRGDEGRNLTRPAVTSVTRRVKYKHAPNRWHGKTKMYHSSIIYHNVLCVVDYKPLLLYDSMAL